MTTAKEARRRERAAWAAMEGYMAVVVVRPGEAPPETFAFYGPFATEYRAETFAAKLADAYQGVEVAVVPLRASEDWDRDTLESFGLHWQSRRESAEE